VVQARPDGPEVRSPVTARPPPVVAGARLPRGSRRPVRSTGLAV